MSVPRDIYTSAMHKQVPNTKETMDKPRDIKAERLLHIEREVEDINKELRLVVELLRSINGYLKESNGRAS